MRRVFVLAVAAVALIPSGRTAAAAQPCRIRGAVRAAAGGSFHAGLVVEFGDGSVRTFCVGFSAGEHPTGLDLLQRSGLPLVLSGTRDDAAVCRIDTDGCDGTGAQCFCHCLNTTAPSCRFWGYYTRSRDGTWTFAQTGASQRLVHDGDVDGWRYANHQGGRSYPSVSAPCALAASTSTSSPLATRATGTSHAPLAGYAIALAVLIAFSAGAVAMRRRSS